MGIGGISIWQLVILIFLFAVPFLIWRTSRRKKSLSGNGNAAESLKGLQGWLYLVAIGIVLGSFVAFANWLLLYNQLLGVAEFNFLLDQFGFQYVALLGFVMLGGVVIIVISFILIHLFFLQSAKCPTWYVNAMLASILLVSIDFAGFAIFFPNEQLLTPDDILDVGKTLLAAAIWIPFMLRSKRVKLTFVNWPASLMHRLFSST